MGYRVYNFRSGGSYRRKSADTEEFYEAMEMTKEGMRMAKEGFERICELSEEMVDEFGERRGGSYGSRGGNYGNRGGYGERDWEDEGMMNERRMRDSRGRYM